jgi:hypothetical protein
MRASVVVTAIVAWLGLAAADAFAGSATGPTLAGDQAQISISSAPPARVIVSLDGDDGSRIVVEFDTAASQPLRRVLRLRSGVTYRAAVSGQRALIGTDDGRGTNTFLATAEWSAGGALACSAADEAAKTTNDEKATLVWRLAAATKPLGDGVEVAVAVPCGAAPPSTAALLQAVRADVAATTDPRAFGLDSAVPEAVSELLSLLAEIAMDKAKAEAMRLFKEKVLHRVCDDLPRSVLGDPPASATNLDPRLLPATCGQLENLRLGDLGASVPAVMAALREDLGTVIVPALVAHLTVELGERIDPALARLMVNLIVRASDGALTVDEVKLALVAFVADKTAAGSVEAAVLRTMIEVAARCASQGCSASEVMTDLENGLGGAREDLLGWALRPATIASLAALATALEVRVAAGPADGQAKAAKAAAAALREADDAAIHRITSAAVKALGANPLAADWTTAVNAATTAIEAYLQENAGADHVKTAAAGGNPAVHWTIAELLPGVVWDGSLTPAALDATAKAALKELARVALGHIQPELAALVIRVERLIMTVPGTPARQVASEAAQLVLDLVEVTRCAPGSRCKQSVGDLRNLIVGAIEGDYLRALGGVSSVLLHRDPQGSTPEHRRQQKRYRAAIALVASVMSYIETYRATAGEDPEDARKKRKQALEALIEAGTNREQREPGWVYSLAATVGYQGGWRKLPYVPDAHDDFTATHDLSLQLGFSALKLKPAGGRQCFFHLSVADLALFAASPSAEGSKADVRWSDFIAIGAQAGVAFGKRIPFDAAVSVSRAPRIRFEYDGGTRTAEGAVRVGGFLGFDVPFFDLN